MTYFWWNFLNQSIFDWRPLQIVLLGLHAHLNSIFAHIIEFNLCHQVLEDKETEVLQVSQVNTLKNQDHSEDNDDKITQILKMLQDLIHAMKLHPEMTNPGTAGSPDDSKVNRQEQDQD